VKNSHINLITNKDDKQARTIIQLKGAIV